VCGPYARKIKAHIDAFEGLLKSQENDLARQFLARFP
jgi:hypothetical protein